MKKVFPALAALMFLLALISCASAKKQAQSSKQTYIAVVSKGFQHQFWQTVYTGSDAAAKDLNLFITFEGPPSETNIDMQLEMIDAALSKKPAALCLAALDVDRLSDKLSAAKAAKIPVIGFDSGIPNAPVGTVVSTASTNNYAAGELAADRLFEEASVKRRILSATSDKKVTIGIISQDTISTSILERTHGFIVKFIKLSEAIHPGAVEVTGDKHFMKSSENKAVVSLKIAIPATTEYADCLVRSEELLSGTPDLIGVFCSNEGTVTGLLAATNEGADFDREKGVYKDITVVGFDAGFSQKHAIKKRYIYGSITQDPFQIGYLAVSLAYKAVKGEKLEAMYDTGCKFYNYENIDDPDIARLVYD